MKITTILNARNIGMDPSRFEDLARASESQGFVRCVRSGSYVVTDAGIRAGIPEHFNQLRKLHTQKRIVQERLRKTMASCEAFKRKLEKKYGPLPENFDDLPSEEVARVLRARARTGS